MTIEEHLFKEGYAYDFFQAVRLLERLEPTRRPVGRGGQLASEVVRFAAHLALSFPPSSIYDIERPIASRPVPLMTVSFMGLTGPSGVLPRHYTELLLRLHRDAKGPERSSFRAWLGLFDHRLISLFYRAWEKYRFYIPYERGDSKRTESDPFTHCLFSLVGLGMPPLRNRLRVAVREERDGLPRERRLTHIEDLALLHYSGFLSHRRRCAVNLEAFLNDYFQFPIEVQQFRGQWLQLDPKNQSQLGEGDNTQLGVNVVAGERVWDVQSKIRLRVGPLRYKQFERLLPSRFPTPARKVFYLLCHLTRLYIGPELDFDIQLVLKKEDVPQCRLGVGDGGVQLGWNTWVRSREFPHDANDAVFAGEEIVFVNSRESR